MSTKGEYQQWADEEYEKNLKNPHRIEIPSPLDFTPDEVKRAASDGKRDGLLIEHMNEQLQEKQKNSSNNTKESDISYSDDYSYNSSNESEVSSRRYSKKGFNPTGMIITLAGIGGCGYVQATYPLHQPLIVTVKLGPHLCVYGK